MRATGSELGSAARAFRASARAAGLTASVPGVLPRERPNGRAVSAAAAAGGTSRGREIGHVGSAEKGGVNALGRGPAALWLLLAAPMAATSREALTSPPTPSPNHL